jgi:hypothetical protein
MEGREEEGEWGREEGGVPRPQEEGVRALRREREEQEEQEERGGEEEEGEGEGFVVVVLGLLLMVVREEGEEGGEALVR